MQCCNCVSLRDGSHERFPKKMNFRVIKKIDTFHMEFNPINQFFFGAPARMNNYVIFEPRNCSVLFLVQLASEEVEVLHDDT